MDTPTIAGAARLIAAKQLSPVELTKHCLAEIEAKNPTLDAFIVVTPERAIEDAKAAEARVMAGAPRGKLDGIPIAHKDIYGTKGIATTAHSKLLQSWVPTENAATVQMLADAGTVMLGKLATHEFAFGGPSFDLPWPPARNPWNPDHFTSGSSSGTGAAVAAGLILGGTGSDTGGSIRGPSALCGIAGIKPTYGLCPRTGILPLSFTLDHAGPMAWTVEDCALLLQAMAGHDPRDPASADRPVPDYSAGIGKDAKGLRIGVVRHWHETDHRADPAALAGIAGALDAWRAQGAEIVEIILPSLFEYQAANFVIMAAEAFSLHEPWMRSRFNDYGMLLRDRMAYGGLLAATDYVQAIRRRRELCVATAAAAQDVDVLVTAGAVGEAPRIDSIPKWQNLAKPGFFNPFNITGWPAMCVCSGFGPGGLPVSVQIAAKPFQEVTLFKVADAFEKATPFRDRRPTLAKVPGEIERTLREAGLAPPASDREAIASVVAELAASASALKGDRPYMNEPAAAFSLKMGSRP
ncbi:MAG TPA: amidase [Acetobacteraceae bacterium]|jgi:aspartyl-tRNA(Asn)/glutamyl-tRNA(Gln) amidotransferase subunit A|nr:amidase [Acetobacteraceae bacterium]